jgi:hypothetical protein
MSVSLSLCFFLSLFIYFSITNFLFVYVCLRFCTSLRFISTLLSTFSTSLAIVVSTVWPICVSIFTLTSLLVCFSFYLPGYLLSPFERVKLPVYFFIFLSAFSHSLRLFCQPVCLYICQSVRLSGHLLVCLSVY